jgi:hypothetical protein
MIVSVIGSRYLVAIHRDGPGANRPDAGFVAPSSLLRRPTAVVRAVASSDMTLAVAPSILDVRFNHPRLNFQDSDHLV